MEEEFSRLAERWHHETGFLSNPSGITDNPAYQSIIAMGERAIPLILQDLKEHGGHWYTALREISGTDPVPVEDWGYVEKMKAVWLQWGRERGYIE